MFGGSDRLSPGPHRHRRRCVSGGDCGHDPIDLLMNLGAFALLSLAAVSAMGWLVLQRQSAVSRRMWEVEHGPPPRATSALRRDLPVLANQAANGGLVRALPGSPSSVVNSSGPRMAAWVGFRSGKSRWASHRAFCSAQGSLSFCLGLSAGTTFVGCGRAGRQSLVRPAEVSH